VLLPDDFGECLRTILAGENSVTHAGTLSPPFRVIQQDLKSRARFCATFPKTKWKKPSDFFHFG
jgi:hypothetical protein